MSKPVDLVCLQEIVNERAKRISLIDVAVHGTPQGDGSSYVVIGDVYVLIAEERGIEIERRTTGDLDELLYWLFDGMTFTAAAAFELTHRRINEDPRRQLFSKQEELLGRLAADWERRKRDEHRHILSLHPFVDARPMNDGCR